MNRLRDVALGLLCAAIAIFFLFVIDRALTAPVAETPVAPSVSLGSFLPVAEAVPSEPVAGPYFINGLLLHQACAQQQSQCVIYMYGVLDTILDFMNCGISEQASKETAQATISSLGRLNSALTDAELLNIGAANLVAQAFITTEAYEVCRAAITSPKSAL